MSVLLDLDLLYQFTRSERLALEALVLSGRPASVAFRQWAEGVDFENIKAASTQLLPALFVRHAQGNARLPHYPRMKGVYRLTHTRNTLSLNAAWRIVGHLQQSGAEVMIFKGAALTLAYYQRPAMRMMGDIDIVVPPQDFERTDAILQEQGWRYRYGDDHRRQVDHSLDYVNTTGQAIDLHRRTLLEVQDPAFDASLFARGPLFDWHGVRVRRPSPEDEALLCMVNAMRELGAVRLLWVCDLASILASTPRFDWSLLWQQARHFGVLAQIFNALQIASHVHGLESIYDVLVEQLAESPDFERRTLRDAIASGATFGLPESKRGLVNRIIGRPDPAAGKDAERDEWAELTETPGSIGVIRIFTTDGGAIKALYLRWRYQPFVPVLFRVNDPSAWEALCRGAPSSGEGVIEVPPGLIEPFVGRLPDEAYQAEISILTSLPTEMTASDLLIVGARVTNLSPLPWPVAPSPPRYFGLSWHVLDRNGGMVSLDHPRHYLRPALLREGSIAFIEPGASLDCRLEFTAPAEPGKYTIQFDLVQESVLWFSSSHADLPRWALAVTDAASPDPAADEVKTALSEA